MLERVRAMRHRIVQRLFQRFVAATAMLSVLVVSAATGGIWLRCRATGVLRAACCCPTADAAEGKPVPAAVESDDCCDRVVTIVDQTPSEVAPPETLATPAIIVASIDAQDAAASAARGARSANEQSRAGPPTARARLLSKQSFLI
jgi:hypothetical protein